MRGIDLLAGACEGNGASGFTLLDGGRHWLEVEALAVAAEDYMVRLPAQFKFQLGQRKVFTNGCLQADESL